MSDTYSEAEMQQILQKALARKTRSGERLTRNQVQEIAEELGVSQEDFLGAEQDWQTQQRAHSDREEYTQAVRRRYRDQVVTYALVNGALLLLNFFLAHRLTWSIYPLTLWGVAVLIQGWSALITDSYQFEQRFQQWLARRQQERLHADIKHKLSHAAVEVTDKVAKTAMTFTDKFATKMSQKVEKWLDDSK